MRRISLVSRMTLLAGTGVALPTLLACLDHPLKDVKYEAASEKQNAVQLTVNKDVDILFVIDNSGSMGDEQGLLAANFPAFIGVLEDPMVKANYRIGVTTTDNGNPWCGDTGPEAGKLQLSSCRSRTGQFVFGGTPPADATAVACTDVCSTDVIEIEPTTTEFDPEPKQRPWLENIEGKTNLGGGITTTEAFQCFGPQGIAGCGFESHLESMYKALLRAQNADEAQYGFLRSNAILSIVVITDEVDCSYNNKYESIFLPPDNGGNRVFWTNPTETVPTSGVCWNAGVVCEGTGTPYDSCSSSNKNVDGDIDVADGDAVLHPLSRYIDFVQEIEVAKQAITPSQEVLVALIAGVPDPYDGSNLTYSNSLDPVEQEDFGIGAGCTYNSAGGMSSARPPVREREFAEAFEIGDEPNLYSICQDDYSDALSAIANAIRDQIRPACMTACVADTDQVTTGLQPQCTLIQEAPDVASGDVIETNIEKCAGDGSLPDGEDVCFLTLVEDNLSEICAEEGWNLEFQLVRRDGVPAPGGTSVSATCQLSQNKQIDCPGLP
jgi:ferredoxin